MPRTEIGRDQDFIYYEVTDGAGHVVGEDREAIPTPAQAHRAELRAALDARVALLQAIVAYADVPATPAVVGAIQAAPAFPAVPAGTLTTAVLSDAVRTLRTLGNENRDAIKAEAQLLAAIRDVAQENRAGAQLLAGVVLDLLQLLRDVLTEVG